MISLFLRRWYQKTLRRNYSNWGGGAGKMSALFQPDQHPNTQGETQQQPHRQVDVAKIKHFGTRKDFRCPFHSFYLSLIQRICIQLNPEKKEAGFSGLKRLFTLFTRQMTSHHLNNCSRADLNKDQTHRHLLVNVEISRDYNNYDPSHLKPFI